MFVQIENRDVYTYKCISSRRGQRCIHATRTYCTGISTRQPRVHGIPAMQHRNPVELFSEKCDTYFKVWVIHTSIQWHPVKLFSEKCDYLLIYLLTTTKIIYIIQHRHPVEIYFQRSATMRVGLRKLGAVVCIELMCCFKVFMDLPWCSQCELHTALVVFVHLFRFALQCTAVEQRNVRDVDCELV